MEKKIYKNFWRINLFMIITLLLSNLNSYSQSKISGTVSDKNGALPGVTVYVKGTKIAAATNESGTFAISAKPGDELIFKMLGYESRVYTVDGKTSIQITLKESKQNLDEVIVTGYVNLKRKLTTSASTSISGAEIANLPAASVDILLQGKLPGVNVQNFSGQPGVKTSVLIRGNTKIPSSSSSFNSDDLYSNPLYVMDGVPLGEDEIRNFDATGTNFLASLNPNDIESIDVLKDAAAAALYGSRGANGVILIKTKRGKTGAPRITFNTYQGYVQRPEKLSTLIGTAERRQKMDLIYLYGKDAQLRDRIPQMLTDSLNPAFNNNNNYQDLFYQSGAVQNYDISASGGSDIFNYRISGGYYNEKGVVLNTGYKRYSFATNLGINFSRNLELLTNFRVSRGSRLVGANEAGSYNYRNTLTINPINMPSSLLQLTESDLDANLNPYKYKRNDNINNDLSGSAELRLTFLKDFRVSTRAAVNYSTANTDYFSPSSLESNGLAYAHAYKSERGKYILTNNLLYTKTIGTKHNLSANFIQEFEQRNNKDVNLYGNGVPNDNIKVVSGIPTGNLFGSSDASSYARLSFMGTAHYDYNEKYMLDAVLRTDASSRFGKNNKWARFPSIAAGWIISNEKFLSQMTWIDQLKLRLSWGRNGDESSISDNARYNSYTPFIGYDGSNGSPLSYGGGSTIIPNFNGITNDNITWEQSDSYNVGLDGTFFKNRLNVTVDAYVRNTTGQMLSIAIPQNSGYLNTFTNSAGVRNSGLELNISGTLIKTKDFQWMPSLNLAYNKNMVTALPNNNRDLYYGSTVYIVGMPLNMYNFLLTDGVINNTSDLIFNPLTGGVGSTKWGTLVLGYPKWRDVNGDYTISDDLGKSDYSFVGDPNPKVTGGFTNFFKYKGFGLNVLTTFTFGRTIVNRTLAQKLQNAFFYGDPKDFARASISDLSQYNYWKRPGDEATFPAFNPFMGLYAWRTDQSLFMEPGWYVRIKSASLNYTFDAKNVDWLKKLSIDNLRIYGTVDNIHMFQKFSGIDAEQVDARGYDYGDGYPVPTKYTLGLTVGF